MLLGLATKSAGFAALKLTPITTMDEEWLQLLTCGGKLFTWKKFCSIATHTHKQLLILLTCGGNGKLFHLKSHKRLNDHKTMFLVKSDGSNHFDHLSAPITYCCTKQPWLKGNEQAKRNHQLWLTKNKINSLYDCSQEGFIHESLLSSRCQEKFVFGNSLLWTSNFLTTEASRWSQIIHWGSLG